jgi:hypothetical protein
MHGPISKWISCSCTSTYNKGTTYLPFVCVIGVTSTSVNRCYVQPIIFLVFPRGTASPILDNHTRIPFTQGCHNLAKRHGDAFLSVPGWKYFSHNWLSSCWRRIWTGMKKTACSQRHVKRWQIVISEQGLRQGSLDAANDRCWCDVTSHISKAAVAAQNIEAI